MTKKKRIRQLIITLTLISLIGTTLTATISAQDSLPHSIHKTQEIYESQQFTDWYYKPSSYSELVFWYQTLELLYPDYIEVFKANELYGTGTITGGYDAYYVRITNETLGLHKPEVLFLGGPHGDETAGTIGMYWFADWFMRHAFHPDYDNPDREWLQWLINNREIYFEASHNPYGYDHAQRYDGNSWDLNREADYDGPGSPTGGIWGSVNGQTLRRFVDNHTIRTGCDFHAGIRVLLYPWTEVHNGVYGTSPLDGETYNNAPPDFYFYDVEGKRVGSYMGDLGGDGLLEGDLVTTIGEYLWYNVYGGICTWAYGADVIRNPVEDPYVDDEIFGNYPGAGIMWLSPEISDIKNVPESSMGNDTVPGWGMEIRRYILHQTDIAQPYIWLLPGTTPTDTVITAGENVTLKWQVNGCLVVDHTSAQWGTDPDPVANPSNSSFDHDTYAGLYSGGTGWENAYDGTIDPVIYTENITLHEPGDHYFVVKAQVDQIYNETLAPGEYGTNHSYLRLVKERVNESYYEELNGTDGLEIIQGQTWWYSPIIHVTVDPGIITHDLALKEGWNLITVPVGNDWTAETLGRNISGCNLVLRFNGSTQSFETYVVGSGYDDFPIVEGVGYFVRVSSDTLFSCAGLSISGVNVTLYDGWNTLGWYPMDNTTAQSLGENTSASLVLMFNATTQEFMTYVMNSGYDNFVISRGMGVFIQASTGGWWHGEG